MEALAVGSQRVLRMWFDWVDECEEVVVTSGGVWPEQWTARLRRGEDTCDVIACQFESMNLMVMPLSTERSATIVRIEAHDTSESEESENDAEDQVQWVIRMWRKHGRANGARGRFELQQSHR